ncbi:MAG: PKD domain-containing protein [bacterium]|nr:PKD domain-containing protein [bacterium]
MRSARLLVLFGILMSSAFLLDNCKGTTATAPQGATLVVSVSPHTISIGGQAVVRVVGYKATGRVLHDGTVIHFSTDLGSIESQKQTENGVAEALFTSNDNQSGDATITVTSGNVEALTATIIITASTLAGLNISANPSQLPVGGGNSTIVVSAYDESQAPVSGIPISLSTSAGQLNSSGAILTTDSEGKVQDLLQTTLAATVTATSGSEKVTIDVTVLGGTKPEAAFVISPTNPKVGERVFFNASASTDSDGSIESYSWDFGDGKSGSGVKPSHRYEETGKYNVQLIVRDNDGLTDDQSNSVTVDEEGVPDFELHATLTNADVGEEITFYVTDLEDDGSITKTEWDFGDGTTALGERVTYSYTSVGIFLVTFTATDNDGNTKSDIMEITISSGNSPTAGFSYSPDSIDVGETVTFDASESSDTGGTIVGYAWDMGDGTNLSGVLITHEYSEAGTFLVQLTVTDDMGNTGVKSETIQVGAGLPNAVISITPTGEVAVGETVTFNGSGSSDNGSITDYEWDFGDQTSRSGVLVTHEYTQPGTYLTQLTVTDDSGNTASASQAVVVSTGQNPVATFTVSPTTPQAGESVTFNASASTYNGPEPTYHWNFGDSQSGSGEITTHIYTAANSYSVTLTITDSANNQGRFTQIVDVSNGEDPVASLSINPTSGNINDTITFNATASTDPDGTIANYAWVYGDGATATGTDAITTHQYTDPGTYTVRLTVTDNDNNEGTDIGTIVIGNGEAPPASFTINPTSGNINDTISFDASNSTDPDGTIATYDWAFGDGATYSGTDATATHEYTATGNYTVSLTVTDNDNNEGTDTEAIVIGNGEAPTALFSINPTSGKINDTINFDAGASYDSDGTIASYAWTYGDGDTDTGVAPDHIYTTPGNYTVNLTVTDNDNNTGIASHTIVIGSGQSPTPAFTISPTSGNINDTISFNASASTDPDGSIASYDWAFGDGDTGTDVTTTHEYTSIGTYTVILTVTDNDNNTGSESHSIHIGYPPTADISYSPNNPTTTDSVAFDGTGSSDTDGTISSWQWTIDGTEESTDSTFNYTFTVPGTYTGVLTVLDNSDRTGTATVDVTVN